ncbi:GMC family oxidoreductase [Hahella sp. SMD15-11]|uniref:GMC family oxidoreductase n=1 Tax=Thermohahella caldifontis TaxID=3142973 RepID=A0AB39UWI8_9GAMM
MSLPDPYTLPEARNWSIEDGRTLPEQSVLEADVIIVGTGAGGGTAAELIAQAGYSVIMVEAGPLLHQKDFTMDEASLYPRLYQEGMSRTTRDGAISILQGRTVGGSTTVNWTSSFRTPDETLRYWETLGVRDITPDSMRPFFEDREKRLNIRPWEVPPNRNNDLLRIGCEKLGWSWGTIPRNVKGCWDLGYCGMGCPTNAKQSMLVTTVPGALAQGARLLTNTQVEQVVWQGDQVTELVAMPQEPGTQTPVGHPIRLRGRHYILAASALGSPLILLKSKAPDPYGVLGKRTFLHPVNGILADMPEKTEPYYGAPQSIYSDEFVWRDGPTGKMGFKLEVPPLHPVLTAGVTGTHGNELTRWMKRLPHMHSVIALMRDGFHPDSPGGTVGIRKDGGPDLDYPLTDYLWEGIREAWLRMGEAAFAAGARRVRPIHLSARDYRSWPEYRDAILSLPMRAHQARLFTAHQMGGCTMGEDPKRSVVNSYGRHHQLGNLSVMDASVFPTSLGANPQLTVYALAARNTRQLLRELGSA